MRATLLLTAFLISSWTISFATDCVDPPASVDVDTEAYATVIANDPFCCNNQWDGICQNAYDNIVGPGENDDPDETACVDAPESVDTDSEAYASVIASDPFCCNSYWDGICQSAYDTLTGGGDEDDEETDCVEAPASVDINSEAYTTVIANDPFCCNSYWDGICQNAYDAIIGEGGGTGDDDDEEGECVSAPASVDMDSEAYATVIANDPFCCNTMWDGICQNAYNNLVDPDDDDEEGDSDCVEAPESVDMDSEAYATVVANDPFCCNNYWDGICQNAYDALTGSGDEDEEESDCVEAPESVDVDSEAYATVIANDTFCCEYLWDGMCQNAYDDIIDSGDDDDEEGECVSAPASVDMDSEAYATVIANDPFCCNNMWDGICQNAYDNLLNADDEEEGPDCVGPPESVDTSSEAYAMLIANDPFCCNYWDNICQIQYDSYGGSGGGGESGDCEADIPAFIDVNSDAFEQVIANDPFCCNSYWDGICQNAYDDYTEGGIIVNPDGGVSGLLDEPFDFALFPNPSSNQVFIQFESVNTDLPIFVRIHNNLGQVVMEKGNIQAEQMSQISLDVSGLSGGIYLLNAVNGEQMMSRQLMVK